MARDRQVVRRHGTMVAEAGPPRYTAFISYSHAADGQLAPALQTSLERFAKPWYRLRSCRVFRDQTGLAVTPGLWSAIQRALASSEFFVLLASPAAAQSEWVQQEVAFWLEHRSPATLLIVLTEGTIAWDAHAGDFDWARTDALPRLLEHRFAEEPNYLDLRWARVDTDLSIRRPKFLEAIASLAATLRRLPLDDLIGEDIAHHRTTRRLLQAGIVLLIALSASALWAAYQATRARNLAEGLEAARANQAAAAQAAADVAARDAEQARVAEGARQRAAALSRELAGQAALQLATDRELSTLLAIEAVEASATPEAEDALRRALARQAPPVVLRGPSDESVRALEFSGDGRRLLGVQADGSVWIWQLTAQGPPAVLPREAIQYPSADRSGASFSPDGSRVLTWPFVVGGRFSERAGDNPASRLWDAATGRRLLDLPHAHLQHAAFSPDGTRVVTAGFGSPGIVIWDAATGRRLAEIDDHEREVVSAEYSRDGRLLLTASRDDTVRIRSAPDGVVQGMITVPGKTFMTAAALSPDGNRIVTLSIDDPARLWDWRGAPGSPLAELGAHEGTVDYAQFSPDSTRLVTLAGDHTARVWDAATGRNVHGLVHDEFIGGAAFSPDSRWIATASVDGLAILWESATGQRFLELGSHDHPRTSVAFSEDGTRIATGTSMGEVLLHPCEVCGATETLLERARSRVTRALSPEERGRYLREP